MARFRNKPVEFEARRFTRESADRVAAWCGGKVLEVTKPSNPGNVALRLEFLTLEGVKNATERDWIIRSAHGEFSTCPAGLFEQKYEPAASLNRRTRMATPLKTQTVLTRMPDATGYQRFQSLSDDEPTVVTRALDLRIEDWIDLGEPDQLTVTIEATPMLAHASSDSRVTLTDDERQALSVFTTWQTARFLREAVERIIADRVRDARTATLADMTPDGETLALLRTAFDTTAALAHAIESLLVIENRTGEYAEDIDGHSADV